MITSGHSEYQGENADGGVVSQGASNYGGAGLLNMVLRRVQKADAALTLQFRLPLQTFFRLWRNLGEPQISLKKFNRI